MTEEKVLEQLISVFGDSPFFELWMERYHQIAESKETQIMLMRQAGFTYRKIQKLLSVAPATIQKVVERYNLAYVPLDHVEDVSKQIEQIERRAKEEGIELW